METTWINKVTASGIVTIDLLDYKPTEQALFLDLKDFLYQELIVREKDFRVRLANFNWEKLRGKAVAIGCSVDSIIPSWVYMAVANRLSGVATHIDYCDSAALDLRLWEQAVLHADFDHLAEKKVVVRAGINIPPVLYLHIHNKLKPLVQSLLYGEAGMPKVIFKT